MIYADLTHRYHSILQLLPKDAKVCLDIGGFSSGVYSDLSSHYSLNIESINLIKDDINNNIPTYVGDFLYFVPKKIYDYTLLIDTLEHMDSSSRIKVIEKAISLAKKGTYLLFPYNDKINLEMETDIRQLFIDNNCLVKNSLIEHFKYGLPDPQSIFEYLNCNKIKYKFRYVTDRRLFFQLFENQFQIKEISKRLIFTYEQCNKLDNISFSNNNTDMYRILIEISNE